MSPLTEYTRSLAETARIAVSYTTVRGRLTRYSVTLVARHDGRWRTIRVYDNTHGRNEIHRHKLSGGKEPARTFHHGTASEAFQVALAQVEAGYEEMIIGWLR